MRDRIECAACYGTGRAGMLARNQVDLLWRSDSTCPICDGRGHIGKPSLRRRVYEWLSRPEVVQ